MVRFHVKASGGDEFIVEGTTTASNDELIAELVNIWNLRLRLAQLCGSMRELARHGPMKPPDEQGIDAIKEEYEDAQIEKGEFYEPDPTGMRNGNGVGPQLAETFERVCADAEQAIDPARARQRRCVTAEELEEKLANMRGAVMMAFPMGLPDVDTVAMTLESEEGLGGTSAGAAVLSAESATLWCAGKEFARGQLVSDRLGSNEKTKVVVKLQSPGAGPPGREAAVSEEERKAMMAHYFKRQEEMKKLAEADEDDYLNSSWADSKGLQRSLRGMNNIKAPGVR